MSEEQLSALLAKLKEDAGLREKLQGAADLDAAVALAQEAGFDVSKDDWLRYQARQVAVAELSDEELAVCVGGGRSKQHAKGLAGLVNWAIENGPAVVMDAVDAKTKAGTAAAIDGIYLMDG